MSEPVISIEGLSKAFRIYKKPTDMLLEMLTGKQRHDQFWALRDISFEVHEHDRIGIIGANGSGKSTLLKIITGNLQKSSGQVEVRGKISAMLSLATSLNPEETGLSNIRFNLMLNGCPKSQVDQITEEIIDFTELGAFIYQPVKTYSAGMNAKLAFGIATAIEPEILIVDEVLSVGDGYFVNKAMKRMVDLCDRGKALLFVSHAVNAIQMLCNKVIWIENGAIRMVGSTEHVLSLYEEDYRRREDEITRAGNRQKKNESEKFVRDCCALSEDFLQLRIIGNEGAGVHDTHYVRSLICKNLTTQSVIAEFNLIETPINGKNGSIDLINSEWGRVYERDGIMCRTLAPRSGKLRGGYFSVPLMNVSEQEIGLCVQFESQSLRGKERLTVEFIDYETGEWMNSKSLSEEIIQDGWSRWYAQVFFSKADSSKITALRSLLAKRLLPKIEINEIDIVSNGSSVRVLKERHPFTVTVDIQVNEIVDCADVHIIIYRDDGGYVFWQSSGMNDGNISPDCGRYQISFDFENNIISAGNYLIGASCSNGWDPINNFPYSEIFDRKVNHVSFKILSEYELVMFGQINQRVPVRINQIDEEKIAND